MNRSGRAKIEVAVDQEVFLLGAGGRGHKRAVGVAEQLQNPLRLLVQGLHRTQHGRLLVQRFAGPRNKRRRECRASCRWGFPEYRPGWSRPRSCSRGLRTWRGCRRTGKLEPSGSPWISCLPENSAIAPPSPSGERKLSCFSAVRPVSGIEDVGVVRGPLFDRPILHGRGHDIGDEGSSFSPDSIV